MSEGKYVVWIEEYSTRYKSQLLGRCKDGAKEMQRAYPELRVVRGHVYDLAWGKRGHWWLVDPSGEVVDPTASQFPAPVEYEEWKAGSEVRVGRCMECGDDIWMTVETLDVEPPHKTFCSKLCEKNSADAANAGYTS